MSINHNRIKVADLETNQPNKTLTTNENGELEFSDVVLETTDTVLNESLVPGTTASDALNSLNIAKALDTNVLHKTSNESFTGIKSAVNTGNTVTNGFYLTNDATTGNGTPLSIENRSSGTGFILSNSGTSTGIGVILNSHTASTGDLLQFKKNNILSSYFDQNGVFRATNTGTANTSGINLTNNGTTPNGISLFLTNNNSGTTQHIYNLSTGRGLVIDSASGSTGNLLEFRKNFASTSYFDQNGILNTITASPGTNTIQAATTAFVLANSVQGSGTIDYISKWSSATGRLVNSRISDSGTIISIPSFAPPTANTENIGTASLYYNQAFIQTGHINNVNSNVTKTNSLTVGMSNTSGLINFVRASDGAIQGGVGYAASNNSSEVRLTSNGGGAFITFHAAGSEGFRLSGNRNLLINSTNDTGLYKLDVGGSIRGTTNLILGSVNNAGNILLARGNDGTQISTYGFYSAAESNEVRALHGGIAGFFTWYTNASSTITEKMRLSNNGNLLIGATTDTGTYKLDVNGASRLNGTITISNPVTSASAYDILTKNSSGIIEKIPSSVLPASGSYTPTISSSLNVTSSNVTISKWTKINNTYSLRINFGISGVTTAGTVSTITINLPFNRTSTAALAVGSGTIGNGGDRIYPVMAISQSASTVTFYFTQSVSEIAGGAVILTYDISE